MSRKLTTSFNFKKGGDVDIQGWCFFNPFETVLKSISFLGKGPKFKKIKFECPVILKSHHKIEIFLRKLFSSSHFNLIWLPSFLFKFPLIPYCFFISVVRTETIAQESLIYNLQRETELVNNEEKPKHKPMAISFPTKEMLWFVYYMCWVCL